MEPSPQLTDIADAIRPAVTPIFLLAGVGITVNILIARLGRIVDRARVLEGQQQQAADARPAVETELRVLSRRARLIYQAIACAMSLCLTVTTLFVGSLLRLQLSTVIVLLFVTAMLSLIGALLTFFREIILATHHLRIGPR
jgi:drug/metabolite transporter (DMT)-like permease